MGTELKGILPKCTYEFQGNTVCLVDHGGLGDASITSEVESVIAALTEEGIDPTTHKIIYLDRADQWTEIVMNGEDVAYFRELNVPNKCAAYAKLLGEQRLTPSRVPTKRHPQPK